MHERPPMALLAVLVLATALGPLALQIFLPALPAIRDDLGVATATVQLAFSLSTLAMAVATLAFGPLSDRYGRRPVLVGGILVFLAGSAVCVVATDIVTLIAGRIVQAAGGTAGLVLSRAIVRDLYPVDRAASMLAYLTMAMVVAPMISPMLGGVLTDLVGWRAVFAAPALVGVGALYGVLRHLPETHRDRGPGRSAAGMLSSFAVLLGSRHFNGFAFQSACAMALFYGFLAGAPFVVMGLLGQTATMYGIMFIAVSGAFMVGNLVAARISPRVGVVRMVRLGSLVVLAGSAVALLAAFVLPWSLTALFAPMVVIAAAQGASMPNAQAGVVSAMPQLAGAASGLGGFLQMGLAALAAQAVGMVQNDTPYPMLVAMLACGIGTVVFSLVADLPRRPTHHG